MQELLYTSAARGLKPGSRGFCTVLSTQGMAAPLATALEGLSGYRPVFPAGDPQSALNPVVHSHLRLQLAGKACHVLSRVGDHGLDYSQRPNKLAHHVVLDPRELSPGGPAALLEMPGFLRTEWQGEPRIIASRPAPLAPEPQIAVCHAWHELTGDAGWAGVLAETFLADLDRLVLLLFQPGQEILPLFTEAISLLPPERRWSVTFSTYFTGLASGTTCLWRAMPSDSKEARDSLRFVNALRIDLGQGSLGPAAGSALVAVARGDRASASTRGAQKCYSYPSVEQDALNEEQLILELDSSDAPSLAPSIQSQTDSLPIRLAGQPPAPPPRRSDRSTSLEETMPAASSRRRSLADVYAKEARRPRPWKWIVIVLMLGGAGTSIGVLTGRNREAPKDALLKGSAEVPVEKEPVTQTRSPEPAASEPLKTTQAVPSAVPQPTVASEKASREPLATSTPSTGPNATAGSDGAPPSLTNKAPETKLPQPGVPDWSVPDFTLALDKNESAILCECPWSPEIEKTIDIKILKPKWVHLEIWSKAPEEPFVGKRFFEIGEKVSGEKVKYARMAVQAVERDYGKRLVVKLERLQNESGAKFSRLEWCTLLVMQQNAKDARYIPLRQVITQRPENTSVGTKELKLVLPVMAVNSDEIELKPAFVDIAVGETRFRLTPNEGKPTSTSQNSYFHRSKELDAATAVEGKKAEYLLLQILVDKPVQEQPFRPILKIRFNNWVAVKRNIEESISGLTTQMKGCRERFLTELPTDTKLIALEPPTALLAEMTAIETKTIATDKDKAKRLGNLRDELLKAYGLRSERSQFVAAFEKSSISALRIHYEVESDGQKHTATLIDLSEVDRPASESANNDTKAKSPSENGAKP